MNKKFLRATQKVEGNEQLPSDLIDSKELQEYLRLSRHHIFLLIRESRKYPDDPDRFPLPHKIGGKNYWSLAEIRAFLTRPATPYFHPSSPQCLERKGKPVC